MTEAMSAMTVSVTIGLTASAMTLSMACLTSALAARVRSCALMPTLDVYADAGPRPRRLRVGRWTVVLVFPGRCKRRGGEKRGRS